jgi:hypothetical protein
MTTHLHLICASDACEWCGIDDALITHSHIVILGHRECVPRPVYALDSDVNLLAVAEEELDSCHVADTQQRLSRSKGELGI